MIVRLMGEGQFELDKKQIDEINKIDNNIVKIVQKGDEKAFRTEIRKLADYVRTKGKPLANTLLKPSELVIPPSDLTLEEAKRIFEGEGLIPD